MVPIPIRGDGGMEKAAPAAMRGRYRLETSVISVAGSFATSTFDISSLISIPELPVVAEARWGPIEVAKSVPHIAREASASAQHVRRIMAAPPCVRR